MIRINLLAVGRDRGKRKAIFQPGQKITIASSLILLAAALSVGWWYRSLQQQSAELDQRIIDANRETTRLRSLINQVNQFEQQQAQLKARVALIDQLRQGQSRPVHMLDQVSRALPDAMWLTELKQQGDDLTINGATFDDAQPVLRAMTDNVLLEIQKTFDFFKATASSDRIDRIMLSGGASRVEGFAAMVQDRFGTPIDDFDPFRRISLDPKKLSIDQRETIGPMAAVAVGLALRAAGDR